jgi:hypothetical protein
VVFLSSVRRGLEEERDNLPALIRAIGHECTRFEDYTAQPIPSREACLRGVDQAHVYLLLLGGRHGEPVFDSGLSPTEEFTRARQRGIPMLVFVKQGVEVEPFQRAFIKRVEEYTGGRFRAGFTTATDLQPKVAAALAELAAQQAPLVFTPLAPATRAELTVPWVYEPAAAGGWAPRSSILECHVLPLTASRLPAASLDVLPERLAELGRLHRLFRAEQALEVAHSPEGVTVSSSNRQETRAGLAAGRGRTVSVWAELEGDALGYIVEAADLTERLAGMLRLAAELVPPDSHVAFAAGLGPTDWIVEGRVSDLGRRTQAGLGTGFGRETPARAEPEDSVPALALRPGSEEIGRELAARLLRQFRVSRR